MVTETISREIRQIDIPRRLHNAKAELALVSWRDWVIAACGVGVFVNCIISARGGY